MYTVFNGQLMQFATVSEEEISVKLTGLEAPVVISKENELFGHYLAEYEGLKNKLLEQQEAQRLKNSGLVAGKPKLV